METRRLAWILKVCRFLKQFCYCFLSNTKNTTDSEFSLTFSDEKEDDKWKKGGHNGILSSVKPILFIFGDKRKDKSLLRNIRIQCHPLVDRQYDTYGPGKTAYVHTVWKVWKGESESILFIACVSCSHLSKTIKSHLYKWRFHASASPAALHRIAIMNIAFSVQVYSIYYRPQDFGVQMYYFLCCLC